ncbi:hypothetical protein Lalb_Chr19g0128251 [Lupinus albus]|uniref:Transmembrane protein n=1 Tax=Lupinus albus TaxID=3870 RepID=A0A6A4NF73_LUPAL|nr:hypothetical protein Lalb_Chr19g0128251 [Lupinus albus]
MKSCIWPPPSSFFWMSSFFFAVGTRWKDLMVATLVIVLVIWRTYYFVVFTLSLFVVFCSLD